MARHRRAYAGERYVTPVTIKLTPTQRAQLAEEAAGCGVSLSTLARLRLTGARLPAMGVDPQLIRGLTAQLAHLGNNLNQLAHIANQTGEIKSQAALEAVTTQIIATLRQVIV